VRRDDALSPGRNDSSQRAPDPGDDDSQWSVAPAGRSKIGKVQIVYLCLVIGVMMMVMVQRRQQPA